MDCIKTPMKGMPEQLPLDMELREYVLGEIKKTYRAFGFMGIETPAIEHIENLTSRQGGENEKLIFRVMKRGAELERAAATGKLENYCDSGLRYDLTVPLARYYANNMSELPSPFKVMQIGPVWRADRPQKGRFRQFTQCDIDILGEKGSLAEIELISATTSALSSLGFGRLLVKINDRRILRAMASVSGFPPERLEEVFILLDKMDKIGMEGVKAELLSAGFEPEAVERYAGLFRGQDCELGASDYFAGRLEGHLEPGVAENLDGIMACAAVSAPKGVELRFDPTLVRGMGYYTGPIFEIEAPGLASSIAGGGRYDDMVGRFCNQSVSACGFSIGFERILTIMKQEGRTAPDVGGRTAMLVENGVEGKRLVELMARAAELRAAGATVMITSRNKNARHQKETLQKYGYDHFEEVFADR